MSRYDHYTSLQLFEQVQKSEDSLRNYLLRLLLQREDSNDYIEILLNNDAKRTDTIRLLSPADVSRFAVTLGKLLNEGDTYTKTIIITRLGDTKDPLLVASLLKRVLDKGEDAFIKKTAITALGNSDDNTVVQPLIQAFDKLDNDSKREILIALGKIGDKKAMPLLQKASQEESDTVKSLAAEILQRFSNQGINEVEKQTDFSVYKIWERHPFSYPDASHLCFFKDNYGNYEESKAGERELNIPFRFRIENEMIIFITGSGEEQRSGYIIKEGSVKHPYHGKLKCLVLRFTNPDISIKRISITGTDYYYIYQNV